jgi:hypothetical protein
MDTIYKDAMKVTWVMDNFSTHKLSFFYEYFTPEVAKSYIDRMEIIHTPAHGSWLNMAEIEFSVFTRQELDRPFSDKKQVQTVAARWMKQQNQKEKKLTGNLKMKMQGLNLQDFIRQFKVF